MERTKGTAAARRRGLQLCVGAAVASLLAASQAGAATFTYTPTNATTDQWASGTNWSAVPASAADTTLVFVGTNSTVIAAATANTNTNNIAGQFDLNVLTLQGTGPGSGTAPVITLASGGTSSGLRFVLNGATTPVLNLNAANGTISLTYNVTQAIELAANTTAQGSGSGGFALSGVVSGTGTLTKTGSSALILANAANTYSNGTTITAGAVRVGASSTGAVGSVTQGPLGTGTITLNGGALTTRDTTGRTINNAVTVAANSSLGSTSTTVNGSLTFGAPLTLTGSRTLTVNSTVTLNGGITESVANAAFTKAGAGGLIVGGTSGYTGATNLTAGTTRFTALSAIGGGTAQNITISADAAMSLSFAPNQSLINRIVPSSGGAIGFASDFSSLDFSGVPTVFLGAASGSTLAPAGPLPVGSGNTYRLGGGGGTLNLTTANLLTGANGLSVGNATGGVVVLDAANNYSGPTVVNSPAILRVNANAALGTSSGLTVGNGARVELNNGITVSGITATINGLGGNNLGAIQAAGATATWDGPVILGSTDARLGTATTAGVLNVNGVIDDGPNSFNLNIRNADGSTGIGSTILRGANTYGGSTGAVVGTLKIDGGNNRLPVGTTLIIGLNNNTIASFDLNGWNQEVAGLQRSGDVANNTVTNTAANTASTFTVANSTANTFAGSLVDTSGVNGASLALAKTNIGTLTLSRANTYSGGTSVQAGVLAGTVDGVLGSGDVTVFSGATLQLSGGTTNNYIGNSADLILAPGTPSVALNFSGTDTIGMLSLDGGVTWLPEGVYGSSSSTAPLANQLPVFSGTGTVTVTATIIPEPASTAMGAMAALGLLSRRRTRRRA